MKALQGAALGLGVVAIWQVLVVPAAADAILQRRYGQAVPIEPADVAARLDSGELGSGTVASQLRTGVERAQRARSTNPGGPSPPPG